MVKQLLSCLINRRRFVVWTAWYRKNTHGSCNREQHRRQFFERCWLVGVGAVIDCQITVVSSAIVDKYIGESARLVREMFGYAKATFSSVPSCVCVCVTVWVRTTNLA